jgi:hypothetical protein
MSTNQSDNDRQSFAECERVFRLLCEAVNESSSIKDRSEYQHSPASYYRDWTLNDEDREKAFAYRREKGQETFIELYKDQRPRNIILLIQLTQLRFTTWYEISLFSLAHELFTLAQYELNKSEVERVFEITSDQDREERIDYVVKAVLKRLFWALPHLILQATHRAIHDSILSYIKTDVEHMNKHRWKNLELPRNFEYLPHEILESLYHPIKVWEDWRQRFIGNKREIPEPELIKLPGQYKELCEAYKNAKKDYRQKKKKFLAAENRRSVEDWREQWKKEFVYYPDLFEDCLMMIYEDEMIMPRQLAYQDLSFTWGYSPDQMRRIINNQKRLREGSKKWLILMRNETFFTALSGS